MISPPRVAVHSDDDEGNLPPGSGVALAAIVGLLFWAGVAIIAI